MKMMPKMDDDKDSINLRSRQNINNTLISNLKRTHSDVEKDKATATGNYDTNSKLKKVGPLPHLSSAHYEIAKGIPIVPKPATTIPIQVYNGNASDNRMIQSPLHAPIHRDKFLSISATVNEVSMMKNPFKINKSLTTDDIDIDVDKDAEIDDNVVAVNDADDDTDDVHVSNMSGTRAKNSIMPSILTTLSAFSIPATPPLAPPCKELRQIRLSLWKNKDKEEHYYLGDIIADNTESSEIDQSSKQKVFNEENIENQWVEYWDGEVGAYYYYNTITGEASWVGPNYS